MRFARPGRPGAASSAHRLAFRALRRFARAEDGSMVVFAMFVMLAMLIVGGMSVDIMRHETARTRLQATLDRAVLAAADLDQTRDPQEVVEDYFDKAGLLDQLSSVTVTETINSRTVNATAEMAIDTMFMDMVGVEALTVPTSGTAMESVSDIEIVLVLDVTGSMGSNNRIVNLRSAAREFVQTILQNDDEDRISIAVVPFNAQVNLGNTLLTAWDARYNVTNLHGMANSACLDMPSSAFAAPGIPTTLALPQSGYFDGLATTTQNQTTYVAPQGIDTNNFTCRLETQNMVRLPSQDINTLRAQIQALTANGNTSITMGMKWAMALIDPSARQFYTDQIAAGRIPATLAGRPYAYDRDNTLKVVVLMTDGEHVSSVYLDPGYRTEQSNLWRTGTGTGATWSAYFDRAGTNLDYWVPSVDGDAGTAGINGIWMAAPHNDTDTDGGGPDTDTDGAGPPVRLNWNQVWSQVRVSWVAWTLYARALGTSNSTRNSQYTTWMNNFLSSTDVAQMNSSLQQSCAQARANNVVVFGIAFEAPAAGQTQIFNCASSPSHYFNAQGLEITTAFRAIASHINALRLTQ